MKTVLFITPYYDPNIVGGAEISTQLIAEGINENSLVVTAGEHKFQRELNNVRIIEVSPKPLTRSWKKVLNGQELNLVDTVLLNVFNNIAIRKWVREYKELIEVENVDVVILNTNIDALGRASIWKAIGEARVPSILVLRDPILLRKKIAGIDFSKPYSKLIKRQVKDVYAFASPSRYMINLYKEWDIKKELQFVVPNSVDNKFFESNFDKKENFVLYAGSIREEKGIRTLLESFRYNELDTRAKIKVFGSGELEGECRRCNYVECFGWIKRMDLYAEMRKAKAVILPSEYPEAFGRILVEAVSQGTLIIGSDAGGIPEILENDNRYMYPAGDSVQLSKLINRILHLRKNEYQAEISDLQLKFQKYTKEAYIDIWEKTINNVLQSYYHQ